MKKMSMRQRLLAVLRGEPHDRVPFIKYDGLLPNQEVWDLIGRDRIGLLRWNNPYRIEHPQCRWEETPTERSDVRGAGGVRITLTTPKGTLHAEYEVEPTYGTRSARERFVKE